MTCRGWKRYAVPCRNRTSNENGLCWLHQHQEALANSLTDPVTTERVECVHLAVAEIEDTLLRSIIRDARTDGSARRWLRENLASA